MSIGEFIRDLRWHRRLKQGELTRRARISQNALSRIELGKTTPSVLVCRRRPLAGSAWKRRSYTRSQESGGRETRYA
jgi:hypothetical protein